MEDPVGKGFTSAHIAAYRAGFVLQALGAFGFTIMYVFSIRHYPYGIAVFTLGVFVSCFLVLSRTLLFRKVFVTAVIAGAALEGLSAVDLPYRGKIFFIGLALVLLAGAAVAAHDAYRCRHLEGWVFIFAYPVLVIPRLAGGGGDKLTILMATLVSMLHVLFLKRLFARPPESRPDVVDAGGPVESENDGAGP